ncbi:plasminogen-like [Bolinopsis microptera]|uniref:plasminogen-like n=1 Tax=Bolinopsis microptera TaxID=2820187 RepID=UPI00307921D0
MKVLLATVILSCYVNSIDVCWSGWNGLQKDYRGSIKETISGETCMKWTDQNPHAHSRTEENYPNSGLGDHNYCRNPDNEPNGAWCYTTNPLQRWDYCPVPSCTEDKCWDGLQKDYRGPLQVTESGEQCQKWTEQYPQEHSRTEENYPEAGLGNHNYCRNPDNEPAGAWCYTTNPDKRWDYCDVPKCPSTLAKKDCWDSLQKDYRGGVKETISGDTCMKWTEQNPHEHSRTEKNYPNSGLGDHNYCRNPDNEPMGAWCYTTNPLQRWDYCPVPSCTEDKCWDGLQKDYRGPLQVTESGEQCQKWTEQYPQEHSRTEGNYPEAGLGNHNYCRNPDNEPAGAWCYTTNPDKRWDYCDVPNCP